jgi:hypothetical protein
MDMSVTEILKELPKLSPTDRAAVWKKLGEITEADVPATFRQGMRDIAKGLTVDMESALREEPPGAATFTM